MFYLKMNQQNQSQSQILFFYSTKCKYCYKFNSLLKFFPSLNIDIKRVCIDNNPNIPSYIRILPTIVINNSEKYEGVTAFKWLENKKKKDVSAMTTEIFDHGFSFLDNNHGANDIHKNGLDKYSKRFFSEKDASQDPNFSFAQNTKISDQEVQRRIHQGNPQVSFDPNARQKLSPNRINRQGFNDSQYSQYINQRQIPQQQHQGQMPSELPDQLKPVKFDTGKNETMILEQLEKLEQQRNHEFPIQQKVAF